MRGPDGMFAGHRRNWAGPSDHATRSLGDSLGRIAEAEWQAERQYREDVTAMIFRAVAGWIEYICDAGNIRTGRSGASRRKGKRRLLTTER